MYPGNQRVISDSADSRLRSWRLRLPSAFCVLRRVRAGIRYWSVSEASRAAALNPDLANSWIIHFATHSVIDVEHPELSGLVLSMVNREGHPIDGILRLLDIYKLKLPVELVVLSSDRAASGRQIRGEGLVGLSRAFMYAGVSAVLSTLNPAEDEATARFMQLFYASVVRGDAPAGAIRRAQMELYATKRWNSPRYWGGFIFQGDWQTARC